ncbi:MAG: histidine kinase dimerization/phospho-acceptor domain-containing protein [Pyrinomonadaceae bacterium]
MQAADVFARHHDSQIGWKRNATASRKNAPPCSFVSKPRGSKRSTEAATAQEALHASQVKDEFLQMVSHEFRTPLTTIKAAARVLLNDGESPEERREYLETISTECDRQIDMIINLLDISRLDESGGA